MENLKQIITNYGSLSTKELLISGCLTETNRCKTVNKLISLDLDFFKCLTTTCSSLSLLSLEYLDLTNISFEIFEPLTNLETFSLKWCLISDNWFKTVSCFYKMKNLYLNRSLGVKLTKFDLDHICRTMPNLICLVINQAESSIGDDSVEIICERLLKLEQLDLINTIITDQAIENICSSDSFCSNLIKLNLSMSSLISNACLSIISDSLHNLKSLHLTSCFGISRLEYFVNLKHLNYLNINNTSIDKQRIKDYLLPQLPNCEIEHGHEKMLNRKLMWTINGSRNSLCV